MEDKAKEKIEQNGQYRAALSLFNDALVNDGSLKLRGTEKINHYTHCKYVTGQTCQ